MEIVVVGGGPAGLMAAIEAARRGRQVAILEALPKAARKLLASGGGRCNLTNTLAPDEMAQHFPAHSRFVEAVLRAFTPDDLRNWFAAIGVETHAPDGLRVFPTTHKSSTVVDQLLQEVERLPISWELECEVTKIVPEEWGFVISAKDGRQFRCGQVVIACGGVGYPEIGNGRGLWDLVGALGHMVSEPQPAMVPLLTKEEWPADCRADTLPKVELVLPGGRKWAWTGDLIFTEKGIAGPVVMDASGEIAAVLNQVGTVVIRLRLRGGWSPEDWRRHLEQAIGASTRTPVGEWLAKETCPSLAVVAATATETDPKTRLGELSRKSRNSLSDWLGGIPLTVTGTAGFEQAMVTRGGVTPREVKADSLESIRIPGLYLAGEVLDIDGPCGGFNLQWAFASGHRVGRKLA